jgi:hypothetical protein
MPMPAPARVSTSTSWPRDPRLPNAAGRHADPVLVILDLLGNADLHARPRVCRKLRLEDGRMRDRAHFRAYAGVRASGA